MLTVQELINMRELALSARAGLAGLRRQVTWAHAVDLPDPWRWIAAGNLVMTTGVGLPHGPQEQVQWLEQLAASNASALVIAPRPDAPSLSLEMLEAADRLTFPIANASFDLEFIKLARCVIESVLQSQRDRLRASEDLFRTYALALSEKGDLAGRLSVLADRLGVELAIEDAGSGVVLASSHRPTPARNPIEVKTIAIAGRSRANLVLHGFSPVVLTDQAMMRSLAGLLSLELERLMIARDDQREEGAAMLRSLLREEADFSLARPMLERRAMTGSLVCLAIQHCTGGHWSAAHVHHAPELHHRSPLLLQDDVLLALADDDAGIVQVLQSQLGPGTVIGISSAVGAASNVREGMRQARLALALARESGTDVQRYGEDAETALVLAPRTLEEARALVCRYLGPVMEHDRRQAASLLATLMAFLDNDANWKATAFDLGIHRQTLVYRLKLIEQLTGFKPTSTEGSARFWFAVQAGRTAKLFTE